MKSKNTDMTSGSPIRLLLLFALPLMLGNIFQNLYVMTDTIIVSRGVGLEALAALGAVDWLSWLLFSIASGFTQGFAILVSQKFGEGDKDAVRHITGVSLRLTILLAIGCTAVGCAMVPLFMLLLNVKESLRSMASMYIYILYGAFILSALYNYSASMLRAVGNSRTPLIAMLASSVTNVVLDLLAVFVLKWGIAGAAGATVFSQGVAGAICLVKIRKTPELCFSRKDLKRDLPLTKPLMKLGLPLSAMNLIISAGGIIVQSVVNKCSIGFIAGYAATNKMYGLLDTAAISYGYAVTTYIGQNYGANRRDRIRSGIWASILLSLITAAIICCFLVLCGRGLVKLFVTSDDAATMEDAVNTGYTFMKIMAFGLPLLYFLYIFRSALQGIGKTVPTMISGIVEFACRVSLAVTVSLLGIGDKILYGEVFAWAGAALFLGISWYHYQFKLFRKDGDGKAAS